MSIDYYGITEEDFNAQLRGKWCRVTDVGLEAVEAAIQGEIYLDPTRFNGMHFEPGTEIITVMPIRIKF